MFEIGLLKALALGILYSRPRLGPRFLYIESSDVLFVQYDLQYEVEIRQCLQLAKQLAGLNSTLRLTLPSKLPSAGAELSPER